MMFETPEMLFGVLDNRVRDTRISSINCSSSDANFDVLKLPRVSDNIYSEMVLDYRDC